MSFLRKYQIKLRLWSIMVFLLSGFLVIAFLSLSQLENTLYTAKDEKNKRLVETVDSVLTHFHSKQLSGELSEAQAQTMAKEIVSAMRYAEGNYFWINDTKGYMVMHPMRPETNGKDMNGFTDPTGNAIYAGFARVAREQGQGRYEYMFPKPGETTPSPKFSHVKHFKPWNWVVGTGTYVDDVDEQYYSTLFTYLLVILILSVIIGGIMIAIMRSIISPLNQAQFAMEDISSGDGNLNAQLSVEGNDELSDLSRNFNHFVEKIRETVVSVNDSVGNLSSASSQLIDTSSKSSESIHQQSDEITQVAAAVNQLTYSLKEAEDISQQVARLVTKVDSDAGSGVSRLSEALVMLENLSNEIDQGVAVINSLASQTESIGSVLDVIRSIAEQTNLLALNAAIEAARAGEQGRGFAVVADEVRTLASRTQQSTEEIDAMIVDLQAKAKKAVDVIINSQGKANDTVNNASEVKNALDTISSSVSQLTDMGKQNAAAASEQSATVSLINQRVESINHIAQETSELSEENRNSGQNVGSISEELATRMSGFSI